ncbi:MAG: response regulator [Sphingosinicella sp.]|nr:response regulator [Sphingosinicella sp.]
MPDAKLESRRILVVEDSPVIAVVLEDMLQDFGCVVVGPAGNMAVALELAASDDIDAAILDINIRGGKIYPVATMLADRDVPFLLASGYADWTLPPELMDRPRLVKPFSAEDVEQKLAELLRRDAQ